MKVYACSDLHGCLHFYNEIKKMLQPEDKVYFLGDAGDRGPHPWETIKAILNDPQFVYIKGNHEVMLCDALLDYISDGYVDYSHMNLLCWNGGDETINQAIREPGVEKYERKLHTLPLICEYTNTQGQRIVMSHAGFTPWKDEFWEDDEKRRDTMFRRPHPRDLVWDRTHFLEEWNAIDCVDCYIIHGHTPIPYLLEEIDPCCKMEEIEPGALWYDNGRKCCIDCGAVFTGQCVLLDLDTWDEHIFVSETAEDN